MKIITNKNGNQIKIYAETFENEAFEQVKRLVDYEPYRNSKIRIMPDAHAGKGCTVGTTIAISDAVTPNLVGVDIGCGMLAVGFDKPIDLSALDETIKEKVPSGFNVHTSPKSKFDFSSLRCAKHVDLGRALHSIGSLGGGNHFIEIDRSEKGYYLVIHSGSRKLGGDVCKYYQDLAFQNLNEMGRVKSLLVEKLKSEGRHKEIDGELKKLQKPSADKDLAHLTGKHFDDYMHDIAIVQKFASLNRTTIADIIIKNTGMSETTRFETVHNYIDFKRMILRKGAVSAELGERLIIPINMRDGSLLCVGKGNADWNYSAPHGAGRLFSRSRAKEIITVEEFSSSMEGIYTSSVGSSTLDEAPQAYKPIGEIISAVGDTVDITEVIKPIYNFKSA